MEQFLKYYYDIYVDNLIVKNNRYSFIYNDELYFLINCNKNKEQLDILNKICVSLLNLGYPVSQIIINKNKELISTIDNKKFILLKINGNTSKDIDILEIASMSEKLMLNNEKRTSLFVNWGELWERKIDYFEYQINELGHDKKIILNSFSYYIGLAENAISIANVQNITNTSNKKMSLSHHRVNYPNMEIDYYNPLNFIFDLRIRDVAEYLKSMFFYTNKEITINELNKYLKKYVLDNYEANMLYARLLYPSYYFDKYESIIEDKEDEDDLLDIINQIDEYEFFLKDIYIILSKNYKIEKVEWLINKKEL